MNITEKLEKIDINKSLLNYLLCYYTIFSNIFLSFCTTILFNNNLLITDFLLLFKNKINKK